MLNSDLHHRMHKPSTAGIVTTQGEYNGAHQTLRNSSGLASRQHDANKRGDSNGASEIYIHPGGLSRPPSKKAKVSETTEVELPSSSIKFFSSTVLKLKVLENLSGEDILATWQASSAFHRALKDPLGLELWNEVRKASGLPLTARPQLPTSNELLTMLYVINSWCQVCRAPNASHQWPFGTRLCAACLIPRLVTRKKFIAVYRDLFDTKQSTLDQIEWINTIDIPGLEFSPMATRSLGADPDDQGHFVALGRLADMAVQIVQRLRRERPTESEALIDKEATESLSKLQAIRRDLLRPVKEVLENTPIGTERLGIQRQKQIIEGLSRMKDLNFHQDDIPDITDPDWRPLVYTGTEITAREWENIRAPLKELFQIRQTARLHEILENCPSPTPASINMPTYHGPDDITGVVVGALPASVFLKICAYLDLESLSELEKSSRGIRDLLSSRAADPTWRTIRNSLGLEAGFDHWPERAYLAYAVRRRCFSCSQEGRSVPFMSSVFCGDCIESNITELRADFGKLPTAIVKVMAHTRSRPFVKSEWIAPSQKNVKLYRTAYLDLMCRWYRGLPVAVKTLAPIKLIVDHVERHTNSFMKVAKQCEAWQAERDPGNVRLMARRAEAIVRRAAQHQHVLGIPGFVFESEAWKRVAEQPRPLCEKEWSKMKEFTLDLLEKDRIVGGIRVADLPDFEDTPSP